MRGDGVPDGWELCRLKDVAHVDTGFAFKSIDFVTDGVPIVRMSNLAAGRLDLSDAVRVPSTMVADLDKFRLQNGDFLIGLSGSLSNFAWVTADDGDCYLNQRVGRIRAYDPATGRFVAYWYLWPATQQKITGDAAGNAQLNISPTQLGSITLALPPQGERQKISAILSSVDEAIQATQAVIDQTRRVKEGLLQDLLTRGLPGHHTRFKQTEIGEIPESWEVMRVDELFETGRGRVISKGYLEDNPGPYPVYSSQTHNDGLFGRIGTYDFEGEYVTWTTDGVNAGTTFFRSGRFNCTNVCGTLKPLRPSVRPAFFAYALSVRTKPYVTRVGNDKLMNNIMAIIPVPVPPADEQQRIADHIGAVDSVFRSRQVVRDQLASLKAGLLQDLLTGKVRVTP